jgi:hypothetical protein
MGASVLVEPHYPPDGQRSDCTHIAPTEVIHDLIERKHEPNDLWLTTDVHNEKWVEG